MNTGTVANPQSKKICREVNSASPSTGRRSSQYAIEAMSMPPNVRKLLAARIEPRCSGGLRSCM